MPDGHLVQYLSRFDGCRIAVVGDLMLDRYIWGRASRISQEAPVPVVRVERETTAPGGAANVVRNILSLGGRADAFGVVGCDTHGRQLLSELGEAGASVAGILDIAERSTTVKTRVIAGSQQVVRIDREHTAPLPKQVGENLLARLRRDVESGQVHAIILEDYAKGVLTRELVTQVVELAVRADVPVALDPHAAHPFNVPGLALITPNRAEAFALAGMYYQPAEGPVEKDEALLAVGQRLQELWDPHYLLITLGGHGMMLFLQNGVPVHIPTRAREVFDVSGAGDTVMAVFVLALVCSASPIDAARLANHAAGIVVAELGTAAVKPDELRADLEDADREEDDA